MGYHELISVRKETLTRLDRYKNKVIKDFGFKKLSRSDVIERLLDIAEKIEVY